jgi:hypothetical protein
VFPIRRFAADLSQPQASESARKAAQSSCFVVFPSRRSRVRYPSSASPGAIEVAVAGDFGRVASLPPSTGASSPRTPITIERSVDSRGPYRRAGCPASALAVRRPRRKRRANRERRPHGWSWVGGAPRSNRQEWALATTRLLAASLQAPDTRVWRMGGERRRAARDALSSPRVSLAWRRVCPVREE